MASEVDVCRWWVVVPECVDSVEMKLDERGDSGPWVKYDEHAEVLAAVRAQRDGTNSVEVNEVRRVLERQAWIRDQRIEQLEDALRAVLAKDSDDEIVKGVLADESWKYLSKGDRRIFTSFSVDVTWERVDDVEQKFPVTVVDVHGKRVDAGHVLYGKGYGKKSRMTGQTANYCAVTPEGERVGFGSRFPVCCLALVDLVVRHRLPEHPGVHMTFVGIEPESEGKGK